MENFWIALGIVLMLLPIILFIREEFLTVKVLKVPVYTTIDSYTGEVYYEILKDAKDDYDVVVLEFDSPGGTFGGIMKFIEGVEYLKKNNVTVIAYIRDSALSGAYWVASHCDYIFAENYSLVGNVGVTASYLNFAGLLKRFNVSYIEIYNGSLKEMGSSFKEPTEEETKRLREIVYQLYKYFLNDVARMRNLTEEEKKRVGTSDIFLGYEAKKLHLVDYIGNFEDVEKFIKKKFGTEEIKVEYPDFSRYV